MADDTAGSSDIAALPVHSCGMVKGGCMLKGYSEYELREGDLLDTSTSRAYA